MGRYYDGDISGKFMFGVQASDAADRFGVIGEQPQELNYNFDEEQLEGILKELKGLEKAFNAVEEFFKKSGGTWTDEAVKVAGLTPQDLSDCADYRLGKAIADCLEEEGYCSFTAEV